MESTTYPEETATRCKEICRKEEALGNQKSNHRRRGQGFLGEEGPEVESVEVKRVFKSEEGRYRWWFWLMGDESVLKVMDQVTFGDFWKIESYSPFLELATVRALSR